MKNNAYFKRIYEVCHEYSEIKRAHEDKKDEIRDTYGWDSPELNAWYARMNEIEKSFPYTSGTMKAYWAFRNCETEELEVSDFCWDKEIEDFIKALRDAGIETFVVTNQSTALMENIHGFIKAGCTMEGACTLEKLSRRWGDEKPEYLMGIRFKVN